MLDILTLLLQQVCHQYTTDSGTNRENFNLAVSGIMKDIVRDSVAIFGVAEAISILASWAIVVNMVMGLAVDPVDPVDLLPSFVDVEHHYGLTLEKVKCSNSGMFTQ